MSRSLALTVPQHPTWLACRASGEDENKVGGSKRALTRQRALGAAQACKEETTEEVAGGPASSDHVPAGASG